MEIGIWDDLFCLKSGDEKWTRLEDFGSRNIADIIVYKGNFYSVNQNGETMKYDPSSFNETNVCSTINYDANKVSSSLFNEWGSKKRLVESCGQLFLVDMFLDMDVKRELRSSDPSWFIPMEIKIHRLDDVLREWIAVHTLDDRIFFAGDDCCFSGELPSNYYDDDFEEDFFGGCLYSDDDDYDVDGGGVKLSTNDDKIDRNDIGSKSSSGLSEELNLDIKD
ncbi:hypothetical protein RND71_042414 [Anisodus tanguticus]|uniref:KIB1-4 beta-propeller domain-containing protein n=1 Tax=Anisodus tanguticus TaxID=243964 RepID=A0AAE1UP41_9SOLA|nr:hypothetical protein RND71_042414 [Anisodus tanguticus]